MRAVVRPAAGAAVVCEPGKGLEYLAVNVEGKPVQVARSLKKEKAAFASLMEKLSFLDDSREDETRWQVTTEGCLELLNAVFGLKDVTVEWPEGVKFRVTHAALGFADLQLSVNRMGNWFEVSGAVALDGKTKLKVAELLRLVREAKGNFIELGKGGFRRTYRKPQKAARGVGPRRRRLRHQNASGVCFQYGTFGRTREERGGN